MNQTKDVIIIGAGISGIAAATRLFERGISNILVLEAENRIGGRIHTFSLPKDEDGYIELGAQWIHGEEKNIVYQLASQRNLTQHTGFGLVNMIHVRSSGEVLDVEISNSLVEKFSEVRKNIDFDWLKKCTSSGEYFISKLLNVFRELNSDKITPDIQEEFIDWCHKYIRSFDGSDSWFESSISTLEEYWPCEGYQWISWKGDGFKSILTILMEKVEEMTNGKFLKEYILLGKEVKEISINEDRIHVKCSNGEMFIGKVVIITVSLGVLKEKYKELFKGYELPAEKILAIENLGIGSVNKIYLKFPHQWLPKDVNGVCILWNSKHKQEYVHQGLEWVTDVYRFSKVDSSVNFICGWITGPSSRKMEQIDEKEILDECVKLLRKLLSKKFAIPNAEYCIKTTWSMSPHFCGSYSFRTPTSDNLGVTSTILSAPLKNENGIPVVFFAGEATHGHYYSTVHGALETGYREAERILSVCELQKNESSGASKTQTANIIS